MPAPRGRILNFFKLTVGRCFFLAFWFGMAAGGVAGSNGPKWLFVALGSVALTFALGAALLYFGWLGSWLLYWLDNFVNQGKSD
jgi:hypothetical protein